MSFKDNFPLIPPTLSLDFVNSASIDPRITFTRSGKATYYNSAGLLATADINVPRIDYDPVTKESKGLLIEESRTNLLTYSEQFDNAVWSKSGGETVQSDSIVAPSGTTTADKFMVGTSTFAQTVQTASSTTSAIHTASIYLCESEIRYVQLRIRNNTAQSNYVRTLIDLSTGNLSLTGNFGNGSGATASAVKVGNFWRVTLSGIADTTGTGTGVSVVVILCKDASGTAANASNSLATDGIYIWGAQLEQGSFPTSYIPTTTATVTRAVDNASMTGTNFSSWYNQSEGTLYSEFDSLSKLTAAQSIALDKYPTPWHIEAGSNDTSPLWYGAQAELTIGGSYNNIGTVPQLVFNKFAVAMASIVGNSATSLNGANAITRNGISSGVASIMGIGNNPFNLEYSSLNGHIKSIKYYPKRLSNAQLQTLTNP